MKLEAEFRAHVPPGVGYGDFHLWRLRLLGMLGGQRLGVIATLFGHERSGNVRVLVDHGQSGV